MHGEYILNPPFRFQGIVNIYLVFTVVFYLLWQFWHLFSKQNLAQYIAFKEKKLHKNIILKNYTKTNIYY